MRKFGEKSKFKYDEKFQKKNESISKDGSFQIS
jgi:hypothetical protein